MGRRISNEEKAEVIDKFSNKLITVRELSKEYGVTRVTIYNVLKAAGVDKKTIFEVPCSGCGVIVKRYRSAIRGTKNSFCSLDCKIAWMKATKATGSGTRFGRQIARKRISKYYPIQPGNMEYHVDGNFFNNMPGNLMLFRTELDLVRYCRFGEAGAIPIWRGDELPLREQGNVRG